MMTPPGRMANEWFEEATRCYVERHQACAWCGKSHRVFKKRRGSRLEYYCYGCNFYVCHDEQLDEYFAAPGELEPALATAG